MTAREAIAYAITHAPRGQKGGPYEADRAAYGSGTPQLSAAARWTFRPVVALGLVRRSIPHARVIRIVRKARPSRLCDACGFLIEAESRRRAPSEASAVEVLRELVRVGTTLAGKTPLPKEDIRVSLECFADEVRDVRTALARARRVLAASGPDPSEVVRAAMSWSEATAANGTARTVALQLACVAYPKAGGK